MGGELTWICLKGGPNVGQYVFELKVYRDCDGITFSQTALTVTQHNYPTVGTTSPVLMNFISITDISPVGYSAGASTSCFDCAGTTGASLGAVEEYIWRSDPIAFAGSPPPEGWHFIWGGGTRSNQITNILSPGSQNWTLRAVMYPYDSDPSPAVNYLASSPCYDSSPRFKELAKTIICSGYPFAYSHNASDDELDQISYSWAEPLGAGYVANNPNASALTFIDPYTFDLPIPGNPTINSETGEIAYSTDSSVLGVFVTCVKVEAWKCGQLVAEIYREVQVMLLNCNTFNPPVDGLNDPPDISAPIGSQVWITDTNSAGLFSYETTVFAGDLVQFNIEAEDSDSYSGGIAQNITLNISGGQVSGDYILSNFCANPPCATFNDGSGSIPPITPGPNGTSLVAPLIVNGFFEWQTSCSHIYADGGVSCNASSNIFNFSIKAYDDFCPANGIGVANIKITVVPPIPDLRCLSVQDNGDIDLTWDYFENTPLTSEPVLIWHSTSFSGPYSVIDTVDFPIETVTHVGGNGNNASQYYYLSNEEGCDTTGADLHSDTLQSIFMDITPINFGISAILNWNAIHDPLLTTSLVDYDMFIKNSGSLFSNYLTTPLLSYLYDAFDSNEDLHFYVEIPDASGCISKSSIGTVNLGDTMTPAIPVISDVSVDANGKSIISWIPSSGADYYIIYLNGNQGDITTDTVFGELSSSYSYGSSFANQYFETFSIRAEDSCGNTKITTPYHNSIYLSSYLDKCTHDLTLKWNKYINWMSGVSYYSVFVEETDLNGVTTIVDTSLVDITEYVVTSLIDKYSYKIYVVANDGDRIFSALSNQILLVADLPKKPDYNYIEYASINHDNGFVEINCLVDNTAAINHYDVLRSFRDVNNFKKVGEVPFVGGTTIHYTDESVETSDNFYQYRIYPVDTCGVRLSAPPVDDLGFVNDTSFAQTILLETEININYSAVDPSLDEEYTNTLVFNEYDKWLGNVLLYRLYRSINREPFNLLPIRTWDRIANPNEELSHIDIVTDFGEGNGRFCYYIEAIEGNSTPYGPVSEGSYSNISCVSQTPIIYVPNTFTPNGDEHNEVFRPFTNFVSEEGYSFTIFSRSGGIIFSTKDPLKGWDGRLNGNMVKDDNYVFHLQYINGVGEITNKTDIITLVR